MLLVFTALFPPVFRVFQLNKPIIRHQNPKNRRENTSQTLRAELISGQLNKQEVKNMQAEILEKISGFVAIGDQREAVAAVEDAFARGLDALTILNKGAAKGLDIVGEQYADGEAFLPELVMAGDTMIAVIRIILSHMSEEEKENNKQGVVVIGQAKGDIHDIGKNLLSALLSVNGFGVIDLGVDVEVNTFVEKAEEHCADIIAISTLLTTSLHYVSDTIRHMTETGNRENYFYIVGGGPVTPGYAAAIGADGWGRNAIDGVELCKQLMARGSPGARSTVVVDSEAESQ